MHEVRIGFIPLVDCAVIVAAHEMGFAERRGIRLVLSREPSWAAIRDKVAFGVLDAAHMLAPMPIAMSLGLGGQPVIPMVAPLGLGRGGNAITVSPALSASMAQQHGLAGVVAERRESGLPRLRLASVYPFSCHYYELRAWLAAAGVAPDEVELLVIPPARMVENLASGLIDGFCVGEPWNLLAQAEGLGCVMATKEDIAAAAPEKVLGATRAWAETHPGMFKSLLVSLRDAAYWADAHRPDLAAMLSQPHYVGVARDILAQALQPRDGTKGGRFDPGADAVTSSEMEWLAAQMRQCGQITGDVTRPECQSIFEMRGSWPPE